ncbi:MAG: hypothetical protein RO009_04085 [Pseudorhodoplanes sp.]|nr:hypothetical protein [Pseudorhodoplanes sp.]
MFLFIRDVAEGNLVEWLDKQCHKAHTNEPDDVAQSSEALAGPLRNIFGVSDKVIAMAMSELLLAAPASKPGWRNVGYSLIAIDTLVHNFLYRSGILSSLGRQHAYGPGCYRDGGCADIIRHISSKIDASRINLAYPRYFPRFVQHAIWRFCSTDEFDVCNGNRIDDSQRCKNTQCALFASCQRLILRQKRHYISISYAIDRMPTH